MMIEKEWKWMHGGKVGKQPRSSSDYHPGGQVIELVVKEGINKARVRLIPLIAGVLGRDYPLTAPVSGFKKSAEMRAVGTNAPDFYGGDGCSIKKKKKRTKRKKNKHKQRPYKKTKRNKYTNKKTKRNKYTNKKARFNRKRK